MIKFRKKLVSWLFDNTQHIYTKHFKKNKPWNVTKEELLKLPEHTFGNHLGQFLHSNGFNLIPKVERHDAYHVMTGYKSNEQDEIALQYLCFGNGKRSLYLFGVLIIGTIILPDYIKYYLRSYRIGKSANPFYNLNYKKLLNTSISDLRAAIFVNLNY